MLIWVMRRGMAYAMLRSRKVGYDESPEHTAMTASSAGEEGRSLVPEGWQDAPGYGGGLQGCGGPRGRGVVGLRSPISCYTSYADVARSMTMSYIGSTSMSRPTGFPEEAKRRLTALQTKK